MLPTSPTTRQEVVPSYLYFQYANDEDLQALVNAYNIEAQGVIDWFNGLNLPYYPSISGTFEVDGVTRNFLDWVAEGIYGYVRPNLSSVINYPLVGATASYRTAELPTATCNRESIQNYIGCPDDIYKRCLTWNFYKGDGFVFSVEWLKRRIYRFFYGINGTDIAGGFTPNVSVQFQDWINTTFVQDIGPTATYMTAEHPTSFFKQTSHSVPVSFRQTIIIRTYNVDQTIVDYFTSAMENGYLYIPLEFQVSINP